MFCFTPRPKPPVTCSGDCFTPDTAVSNIPNKCVDLYTKFSSHENSTNKDLHFRFFYTNTNQTINQTINNVSFFINMTKQDKTLEHDLFYTHSGIFTIKFQKNDQVGQGTVDGDHDPVLGGWTSPNDTVTIHSSLFTNGGLYHFNTEILTLDYANLIIDQTSPPKFDSWWSVDDKGNVSKYDNDINVNYPKLGNQPVLHTVQSPLKQLQDNGIFGYAVKCNQEFVVVVKKLDSSPACVKPDTAQKLVERGWSASAVKTVWFEYDELNGIKPPWDSYSGGMPYSQGYYVQNYFKEREITIFDAKLTFAFNNEGHLFFLVSQDDVNKMMNFGFTIITSPPSNTHFCSSINGC